MAWNPTLKINVREVFDRAYSDKPKELRDKLRRYITDPSVKREFGQAVIDEIVTRTQEQRIDKNNKTLLGYSRAYAQSVTGQAYGKSEGEPADLTATGSMLSSLYVDKITTTDVIIRIQGDDNRSKAQGHISGKLGNSKKRYVRDFFGLPKDVEEELLQATIKTARSTSFDVLADLATATASATEEFFIGVDVPVEEEG